MRYVKFATKEFYHIYNRGVDKRDIFMDADDVARFLICMSLFNVQDPIGSIYENSFRESLGSSAPKSGALVNFVAYCLNQNHYHFILEPLVENGIQKFMHKLSTGYTNYFNEKYERSGALFQGRYKAVHINSNTYLLYLSVYVNLNNRVHKGLNKKWMNNPNFSSFREYVEETSKLFCGKDIVLGQFSKKEYKTFCEEILPEILRRKEEEKEMKAMLLE
ncbi:MAG: transposase [Candidatus Paceibacterota bacterium]